MYLEDKVKLFLLQKLQETKAEPETKKLFLERIKALNINEGVFNKLNCKRLYSALKYQEKDYKSFLEAAKKEKNEKKRQIMLDGAKGIKFTMNKTKEKIKKNCSKKS